MLLILGDGAVAHVENKLDSKAILVAANGSKLHLDGDTETVGACFTNGAALDVADTESAWLIDTLRFLGFTLRKRKPTVPYKEKRKRDTNRR